MYGELLYKLSKQLLNTSVKDILRQSQQVTIKATTAGLYASSGNK